MKELTANRKSPSLFLAGNHVEIPEDVVAVEPAEQRRAVGGSVVLPFQPVEMPGKEFQGGLLRELGLIFGFFHKHGNFNLQWWIGPRKCRRNGPAAPPPWSFAGETAPALGKAAISLEVGSSFQLECGRMDDMVVGHQRVAGQAIGAETKIPAVTSRLELLLPGAGDVAQKVLCLLPGTL